MPAALVSGSSSSSSLIADGEERVREEEPSDAATVRATKIGRARLAAKLRGENALLMQALCGRSKRSTGGIEEGDEDDEEAERTFWINSLAMAMVAASNELDSVAAELAILDGRQAAAPAEAAPRPLRSSAAQPSRVTQPFTLVKSRAQVAEGVFRASHALPTMTIDEYLRIERARGGILGAAAPPACSDDDDDDNDDNDDDKGRMDAIRFDAFKDDNRRGQGNTFNLG